MFRPDQPDFGANEEFFLVPPPRSLPPALLARAQGSSLRENGFAILFGTIFLLVGLPLGLVFFPWHLFDYAELRTMPTTTVEATVTDVTPTSWSVNGRPVFRVSYSFDDDHLRLSGQSYFTRGFDPGSKLSVEYLPSRPEINRAQGGDLDPAGNFTAFVLIFPLIGSGFFLAGMIRLLRGRSMNVRLLREGILAEGRVEEVRETMVRVNRQMRHRVTVSYVAVGPRRTSYYAYGQDVATARNWQNEGRVLKVLYDPRRPSQALILDRILPAERPLP